MKKFSWFLMVLVAGALSLTACDGEVSFSTANLQNARLAKDDSGSEVTETFGQQDTIFVLVDLANAPDGTTISAVFTAVDVGDVAEPNTLIDEVSLETGSAPITFNLPPSTGWPIGNYKVELLLNGELAETLNYAVVGS